MSIDEIMEAFVFTEQYRMPREAIRAAVEQRAAITPVLIHELKMCFEDYRHDRLIEEGNSIFINIVAYLLASFGEKEAHEPLLALFSMDDENCDWLWSDSLAEDGARMLLSTFPGDPAPMQRLVEDENADEFARAQALTGLYGAVKASLWDAPAFVGYLTALFRGKIQRSPGYVWDEMMSLAGLLKVEHLEPDILKAYDERLAESMGSTDLKVLLQVLHGLDPCGVWDSRDVKLIVDVEAELGRWPFVQTRPSKPMEKIKIKTGRNDPCVCGSGKKYKKCCGSAAGSN